MTQTTNAVTPINKGERTVQIIKSDYIKFPELYMDVFVVSDDPYEHSAFAKMFVKAYCRKAETIDKADLVVFTGGEDLNPKLYHQKAHESVRWNDRRDKKDIEAYSKCYQEGIPMLGICRGAQFLHVMNGGELYQHVDHHTGDHRMYCTRQKKMIERVSSVHHQLVVENRMMEVLGFVAGKSEERWVSPSQVEKGPNSDIEAFFYRDTCSIGIQGHPEYSGYDEFLEWTFDTLLNLIDYNPDLKLIDSFRRIPPDTLHMREETFLKL